MIQQVTFFKSNATQKGYFVLEFSIVALTVSTLFIIAVLFYYPIYLERAKLAEGITLASAVVRTQFVEYYSLHGQFPSTGADLGMVFKTGKYTSNISIDQGAVTATLLLQDNQSSLLTFRPALLDDSEYKIILPICGYATHPAQSVIYGENQTNIPQRYLPHTCR
jgi:type IV pilus assembly protein PilA